MVCSMNEFEFGQFYNIKITTIVYIQTAPLQLADEKDTIRHKRQGEEKIDSDVCCFQSLPDI